jgi:hypothetical protein
MLGAVNVPVLICGRINGEFISYSQIVLSATPNISNFSFWLEVIDSPILPISGSAFPYIQLWGQANPNTGSVVPFPPSDGGANNPDTIPLAGVGTSAIGFPPAIGQFLCGNLVNLFDSQFNKTPSGSGAASGLASGTKMNYRGDWTDDSISGQIIYPGDAVRDVPPGGSVASLTVTLYESLFFINGVVTRPSADPTVWLPLVY